MVTEIKKLDDIKDLPYWEVVYFNSEEVLGKRQMIKYIYDYEPRFSISQGKTIDFHLVEGRVSGEKEEKLAEYCVGFITPKKMPLRISMGIEDCLSDVIEDAYRNFEGSSLPDELDVEEGVDTYYTGIIVDEKLPDEKTILITNCPELPGLDSVIEYSERFYDILKSSDTIS